MFKIPPNAPNSGAGPVGPGPGHILTQHLPSTQSPQPQSPVHLPINLVKHGLHSFSSPPPPNSQPHHPQLPISNGHTPHGPYPGISSKPTINSSSETMTLVKDPLSNTGYSRSSVSLPDSAPLYCRSIQMAFQTQPHVQDLSFSSKQPVGPCQLGGTPTTTSISVTKHGTQIKQCSRITQPASVAPRLTQPSSGNSSSSALNGYYPRFNGPTSNSGMKPIPSTGAPSELCQSQGVFNRASAMPIAPAGALTPKPNSSNIVQITTSSSTLPSTPNSGALHPQAHHSGPTASLLLNKNLGGGSLNNVCSVYNKATPAIRHTLPHNTSAQQITSTLSKYASTPPPPQAGTHEFFLWFCHLVLKLENYTESDSIKNRHLMTALRVGIAGPKPLPPPKRKTVRKNLSLPPVLNGDLVKRDSFERVGLPLASGSPPKKQRRPSGMNGKKPSRTTISPRKRLLDQSVPRSPNKPKRKPRVKRVIETRLEFNAAKGPAVNGEVIRARAPSGNQDQRTVITNETQDEIIPPVSGIIPITPIKLKLSLPPNPLKEEDDGEMFVDEQDSPNSQNNDKCSPIPKPLTRGRKISTSPLNSIGESGTHSSSTDGDTGGEAEPEPEPEGDPAEEAEAWDQITCWCGKPYAGRAMIECEICLVWLHQSCMKIRKVPEHFQCPRCRRNSGNNPHGTPVASTSSFLTSNPFSSSSKAPKRRPTLNSASSGLYDDMLYDGLDPD